jgi:hypothetical protein
MMKNRLKGNNQKQTAMFFENRAGNSDGFVEFYLLSLYIQGRAWG